jgi:hypothetical protein
LRDVVIVDHRGVQFAGGLRPLQSVSLAMSEVMEPERSRTKRRSTGCGVGFWVWIPQFMSAVATAASMLPVDSVLPPAGGGALTTPVLPPLLSAPVL